ncbi:AIG2 family protein [Colletotrichum truncatum]|uniref:AIG2 family protein n=1 Tax=Colletotrichum truncatum TaxID=5467 RepID=A0ACC3YGF6_COLTU|nr:AIG2 family protein [Colletotrichum truncatum]KAF6785438.1 AIG2 family protein [Colletotrichum truncatum]
MSEPPVPRLYFAYGSNLSPTQMALRCPSSEPIGLAHLPGYNFIINDRHYANIVPSPGPADPTDPGVYGVVYTLPPEDEAALDRCEGVPHAYQKQTLAVDLSAVADFESAPEPAAPHASESAADPTTAAAAPPLPKEKKTVNALIYIDGARQTPSTPYPEYIDRMNRGVQEASSRFGLPASYVDEVIRKWIPASNAPIVDAGAIEDPFLSNA